MTLAFGYNAGLPYHTDGAWGCRLIVTQDGTTDFLADRTDAFGDDRGRLFDLLEAKYPLKKLRSDVEAGLKTYLISTRKADEVVLYEDDDMKVLGNSNASAGYFYVAAFLKSEKKIVNPTTKDATALLNREVRVQYTSGPEVWGKLLSVGLPNNGEEPFITVLPNPEPVLPAVDIPLNAIAAVWTR